MDKKQVLSSLALLIGVPALIMLLPTTDQERAHKQAMEERAPYDRCVEQGSVVAIGAYHGLNAGITEAQSLQAIAQSDVGLPQHVQQHIVSTIFRRERSEAAADELTAMIKHYCSDLAGYRLPF